MPGPMHKGSCLCGAVTFAVEGELRPPDACHCTNCRKQSGHYFASTDVPRATAMSASVAPIAHAQSRAGVWAIRIIDGHCGPRLGLAGTSGNHGHPGSTVSRAAAANAAAAHNITEPYECDNWVIRLL